MQTRVNRWLMLWTATLVAMLYFGLAFQFGAFFIALLDTFNRDRSSTTTIQSLHVGLTVGFGVISGTLVTRYGLHRVSLVASILVPVGFLLSFFATSIEYLYVSVGIVTGIGNSMGFISSVVALGRVFSGPRMVFSLAIHSFSVAVGGVIYSYLIDILLSQFGLRGTFLILAALQSNASAFSVMCWINKDRLNEFNVRSNKSQETTKISADLGDRTTFYKNVSPLKSYKPNIDSSHNVKLNFYKGNGIVIRNSIEQIKKETTWRKCITFLREMFLNFRILTDSKIFLVLLVSFGFTMGSINAYIGLILDISRWKGLTGKQGLFSFVVFNISSGIARLLPGVLKQKRGVSLFIFPICSTLSGCISGLLVNFGTNYVSYVAATCLVGIAIGGTVSSMTTIPIKIIPRKQVPVAIGLLFTLNGILATVLGPIFGKLRDETGSYSSVLLTISVIHALGVVLCSTALILRRREIGRKSVDAPKPNVSTITKF